MPYINIKVTDEGVSRQQKELLISGVTELLQDVLGKDPKFTHVVIDEIPTDNWGVTGMTTTEFREKESNND
ncbi:MAG: 4-oxalocrotonate tautomerase family protein [Gammaproteobacteria bacterium]